MLVNKAFLIRIREGEEPRTPHYASAAAIRDGNLLSRDGRLPYVTTICLIPNRNDPRSRPLYGIF